MKSAALKKDQWVGVGQDVDYQQGAVGVACTALDAPLWDSEVGRESGKDLGLIDKEFSGERNKHLLWRLRHGEWERVAGGGRGKDVLLRTQTSEFGKGSGVHFFSCHPSSVLH